MMMCVRRLNVVALLAGIAAAPQASAQVAASAETKPGGDAAPTAFVRVRGNRFFVGQQPFRFVGANLSIMHGPENRAAAEDVIAGAAQDGIGVARVWALGEGDAAAAPWLRDNFLFRAGPAGWIDAGPRHLDRVIAAAGRAGIRLIVTLSNSWSDYGGVPRYLRWVGRWREGVYGAADQFYSDARARAAYRAHVERLLSRTNHVTGVRYRDDPTIFAWELMNESSVSTASGAAARRAWITEMAGLIRRLAPNHLITSGVSGYRVARERDEWLAVCRSPGVDFCDGHIYPEEAVRDRDPVGAAAELNAMLDEYVRLAQTVAGKPFVLGEFGVHGDGGGLWLGAPRALWTARIFERLRTDGAGGGLIWIYQRAGGLDRVHGVDVAAEPASGPTTPDPAGITIRRAIRAAAAALRSDLAAAATAGAPPFNPAVASPLGETPLVPLHREVAGRAASVPFVHRDRPDAGGGWSITWDPTAFARADWEATGVYGGGEIEHAWGAETGWFEYEYEVRTPEVGARADGSDTNPAQAETPRPGRISGVVRARVSSEYPGTLSPPDGASLFEVALDGVSVATGIAVRDDGRGRWVTLRIQRGKLTSDPLAPGRHRLRFTVPPGPRAHGLAIYGRPGAKATGSADTAPIELRLSLMP